MHAADAENTSRIIITPVLYFNLHRNALLAFSMLKKGDAASNFFFILTFVLKPMMFNIMIVTLYDVCHCLWAFTDHCCCVCANKYCLTTNFFLPFGTEGKCGPKMSENSKQRRGGGCSL